MSDLFCLRNFCLEEDYYRVKFTLYKQYGKKDRHSYWKRFPMSLVKKLGGIENVLSEFTKKFDCPYAVMAIYKRTNQKTTEVIL